MQERQAACCKSIYKVHDLVKQSREYYAMEVYNRPVRIHVNIQQHLIDQEQIEPAAVKRKKKKKKMI
jgi:hypothetical protein